MSIQCPAPREEDEVVLLGHGAGGRLTAELLDRNVLPAFGGSAGPLEDAALLPGYRELVVSTDSFVVSRRGGPAAGRTSFRPGLVGQGRAGRRRARHHR